MVNRSYIWCILLLSPLPLMANPSNPLKKLVILAALVRKNSFYYLEEATFPHISGKPLKAAPVTREIAVQTDFSNTLATYCLTMNLKEITEKDVTLHCELAKKLATSNHDDAKNDSFTGTISFSSPLDYSITFPHDSESITLKLRARIVNN